MKWTTPVFSREFADALCGRITVAMIGLCTLAFLCALARALFPALFESYPVLADTAADIGYATIVAIYVGAQAMTFIDPPADRNGHRHAAMS